MRDILRACADTGLAWVAELVAQRVHRGARLGTVRASLSRTLRRLWRLGLVDLAPARDRDKTMTQEAREWQTRSDDAKAYRRAVAFRKAYGMTLPKDRAAYQAECAHRAEHEVRVRRVLLTDAGRRWLSVNSGPPATVNRRRHSVNSPVHDGVNRRAR